MDLQPEAGTLRVTLKCENGAYGNVVAVSLLRGAR
jgi:hypothetical protein